MKKILLYCAAFCLASLLVSCEHSGQNITEFSGEYRYYAGIAEFFDCKGRVKYYVAEAGINTDLQEKYMKLGLKEKDDAYIKVTGYLKEEAQMEGIDPATLFVPVKFISFDTSRGCGRGHREGG